MTIPPNSQIRLHHLQDLPLGQVSHLTGLVGTNHRAGPAALAQGDKVTVKADGENEELACRTLADLFAYHFDFPPNEG
jgi:hypothetical protein